MTKSTAPVSAGSPPEDAQGKAPFAVGDIVTNPLRLGEWTVTECHFIGRRWCVDMVQGSEDDGWFAEYVTLVRRSAQTERVEKALPPLPAETFRNLRRNNGLMLTGPLA